MSPGLLLGQLTVNPVPREHEEDTRYPSWLLFCVLFMLPRDWIYSQPGEQKTGRHDSARQDLLIVHMKAGAVRQPFSTRAPWERLLRATAHNNMARPRIVRTGACLTQLNIAHSRWRRLDKQHCAYILYNECLLRGVQPNNPNKFATALSSTTTTHYDRRRETEAEGLRLYNVCFLYVL